MARQGTWARDFLLGLIALAVIGVGVIAAVYFIFSTVSDFLTKASPELGSALIGTAGLVFVAVIANFGAKIYEQRQQIQEEHRGKKVEVYQEFMEFWFKFLTGGTDENEEDGEGASDSEKPTEIQRYLREFTHKLVAWGSESVISEYVVFIDRIKNDDDHAFLSFEKVLLEMRRDIGFKNKNLNKGDLLRVFLDRPGIDALIASEGQTGKRSEDDSTEAMGDGDKPSGNGNARCSLGACFADSTGPNGLGSSGGGGFLGTDQRGRAGECT